VKDFITAAAAHLERRAERQTAESDEFGRLVNGIPGGRSYECTDESGQLVSSLVLDSPGGRLVYRIIGVSAADLI